MNREESPEIPKLKGVDALLQKTQQAAAAADPAPSTTPPGNEKPTAAPAAQPADVFTPEELDALDRSITEMGEISPDGPMVIVSKLLNTLSLHIDNSQHSIKSLMHESSFMSMCLIALCLNRNGKALRIDVEKLRLVARLGRDKTPPALGVTKAEDGSVLLTAVIPDPPKIVLAQQMPEGKN